MLSNYVSSIDRMVESIQGYPWDKKLAYASFLAQTYYFVSHSTRLLAASAARFSLQDQSMHRRFLKHTQEETSHELLASRDLQKLGFSIEDFPELPETRNLYETQYYKIEHKDPAALMGYILALETAASRTLSDLKCRLVEYWGANVVSFVEVHADEDPDHVDKAIEVIRGLEDTRLPEIDLNIRQTSINYVRMLDACLLQASIKEQ